MISIIMPVYNEENIIREVLAALPYNDKIEAIVVDGGSQDRTLEFAKGFPVKAIRAVKGRASQMNAGAKIARGDMLLFLHADCFLEKGALSDAQACLKDGCIGGCFSLRINSDKIVYRLIEASGNIRARMSKIFYGDQAIFVRRDIFQKLGGYDDVPLFEDIFFSRKMKSRGKVKILDKKVFASSRRWDNSGTVRAILIYWLLTAGLHLRIPFDILKRIYNDIR